MFGVRGRAKPGRQTPRRWHVREEVEEAEDLEERAEEGVAAEDEEDAEVEAGGRPDLVLVEEEAEHARGAEVEGQPEDEAQLFLVVCFDVVGVG